MLTTFLKPFSWPTSPEIRIILKAGCLAGLVRGTWTLLSGYEHLLAHKRTSAGSSSMQETEPSRPSLQLGHASLESGSLISPTHETPHLCLRHKGSDLCLPCSLSLEVICCSQRGRTCCLWLLLLLFPSTLGMWWREH